MQPLVFNSAHYVYTQVPRAGALYCLHTQAEPSLMACEKQMSAYAAACFSLRSLYLKKE